jgi:hypothetical protein
MGFVRVEEVAKGEQLIANQGQEWMGIHTTSNKAGFQVIEKKWVT